MTSLGQNIFDFFKENNFWIDFKIWIIQMILGVVISQKYQLRPCSARKMRLRYIQKYKRTNFMPCKDEELGEVIPRQFR